MAYEPNLLDNINRRLLDELQRDGRVAFAELGRRVGLSAPAVAERVGRLEREGVITGYRAEVDARAIGYQLAAVVRVRPFARQIHKIPEIAARTPEIVECERITGEDCYLLRLHVRTMEDLEPVLDRFTPFGQTTTSIVHSAPVPRRALPLDAGA
jgi:Lrp/AsnC family leucine-responsive transcriptional regulator